MRSFYTALLKKAGFILNNRTIDPICFPENLLTFSTVHFKDYKSSSPKFKLSLVALAVAALIKPKVAPNVYYPWAKDRAKIISLYANEFHKLSTFCANPQILLLLYHMLARTDKQDAVFPLLLRKYASELLLQSNFYQSFR
jgi:hypothetical protein